MAPQQARSPHASGAQRAAPELGDALHLCLPPTRQKTGPRNQKGYRDHKWKASPFSSIFHHFPMMICFFPKSCFSPFRGDPELRQVKIRDVPDFPPELSHPLGLRDLTLLTFLYNTGARVSKAVALDVPDVRFEAPAQVRITGKGRKQRWCPLWSETVKRLRAYLQQRRLNDRSPQPLFVNARAQRISRHGVNVIVQRHFRTAAKQRRSLERKRIGPHTAAMHLLQAGVEINVIRAWLGHVSVATTSQYIEIDMKMKREALQRCELPATTTVRWTSWRRREDLIQWLHDL